MKHQPMIAELIEAVALELGVPPGEVFNGRRFKLHVAARHVVMWALRKNRTEPSFPDIGRMLNPEQPIDHTTIMHGYRRIELEISDGSDLGRIALKFAPPPDPTTGPDLRLVVDNVGKAG